MKRLREAPGYIQLLIFVVPLVVIGFALDLAGLHSRWERAGYLVFMLVAAAVWLLLLRKPKDAA